MTTPPRCPTCKWWDLSTQAAVVDPDTTGACRRRPPFVDDRTGLAMWPKTYFVDWCAEHEFAPVPRQCACGNNPGGDCDPSNCELPF